MLNPLNSLKNGFKNIMKLPDHKKVDGNIHEIDENFERIDDLVRDGKIDDAINTLNSSMNLSQYQPLILRKMAELFKIKNDNNNALNHLYMAIEQKHDDVESYEMIFDLLLAKGDYVKTIEYALRFLRIYPNSLSAREVLFFAYLHSGEIECALRVVNELIRLEPHSAENHYKRAYIYNEMGEVSSAIQDLVHVLNNNPDDEMEEKAKNALYELDSFQIRNIITLAVEDFVFRTKLMRDLESALSERGYYLSYTGINLLRQISFDNLPNVSPDGNHHAYN